MAAAVELACRAPSLHNSQPWRWVARGTGIQLFVDPYRTITSTDRSGREAIISCGAALDHFRVAMAAVGWDTHTERFPNPNDQDHLASLGFASAGRVTQAWRERADAIRRRRTNRLPFRAPTHWAASLELALRNRLDNDSVILDVMADGARPRLVQASRLTEDLRGYDSLYNQEILWWTAPLREGEGIPSSALVSESDARRVDMNRAFPTDPCQRSSAGTQDKAKILVLSTPGDTRLDALNCGEALSAILLECTMAGLATCPVTHITELESSREMIRDLISAPAAVPQVVIRVGIEPEDELAPPPTPRRPLREVFEIPT